MQIASSRDLRFASEAEITDDFRTSELAIYRTKAASEGRPEASITGLVGRR